ncbi:hypothetical protein [Shouchella lonarensis]|uniref:Uncharacterized protein n=1 Tax=Shouchella lonarensis TaxID=1464122 RepID=A0A1G6IJC5_9BACI|nr:hypothetical protein [Shouchella lonarensis]SDC06598.1 hypothetical protein SAMN05421737_10584 [Shouchella lonarensis]
MSEQQQIQQLKEQVEFLQEAVQFLSFSKKTDEKYAFWNWLVQNNVFGESRMRLDALMFILNERLQGEPVSKKDFPRVSRDLLYKEGSPTREEVKQLFMEALDTENEAMIDDLFESLQSQGIQSGLTELYFSKCV